MHDIHQFANKVKVASFFQNIIWRMKVAIDKEIQSVIDYLRAGQRVWLRSYLATVLPLFPFLGANHRRNDCKLY